jgi:hypothetical protein
MRRSARTDLCRGRSAMVVPTASLRNPPTKTRTLPGVIKAVRFVSELPLSYPVRAGVLLAAAPLLSCLSTPSMTDSEMACCKKMAGNCDMGMGNHSCCKTTVSTPQLVAISHNSQVYQPDGLVVVQRVFTNANAGLASEIVRVGPSPIPISPPGSQSVLRI